MVIGRPRKYYPFTPAGILARMTPGIIYSASGMATKYERELEEVRAVMNQMLAAGLISRPDDPRFKNDYWRPPAPADVAPLEAEPAPPGIAAQRLFVRREEALRGYDAQHANRAQLCMLARERA